MQMLDTVMSGVAGRAPSLFLLIVDSDTRRYALEGPVSDATAWEKEVENIRRNRRNVQCYHVHKDSVADMVEQLRSDHFDEWPPRSIIDPPNELGLTYTYVVEARNRDGDTFHTFRPMFGQLAGTADMWPSGETEVASERNPMAGAWLVETVIVALVLLLVGKLFGIAITIYTFAVSLALATALMLLWDFINRRFVELTTKRRR